MKLPPKGALAAAAFAVAGVLAEVAFVAGSEAAGFVAGLEAAAFAVALAATEVG